METICGAPFVFDHGGVPDPIEDDPTGGANRVLVGRAPAGEARPCTSTKPLRGLRIYPPGHAEHITQPV